MQFGWLFKNEETDLDIMILDIVIFRLKQSKT